MREPLRRYVAFVFAVLLFWAGVALMYLAFDAQRFSGKIGFAGIAFVCAACAWIWEDYIKPDLHGGRR